jgi:hypothetical protein
MGWFSPREKKVQQQEPLYPTDLEYPLVGLTSVDAWRLRDACEGAQIFGAIGSGKTSGSGQTIAKSFLRAGYGGLVLTAKKEEREDWEAYCRATGRQDSLIIFSPSHKWCFNFMDYEMRRPGPGAGLTDNLVSLFYQVLENADRMSPDGQTSDAFWGRAMKRMLRNAIELVRYGTGQLSLEDIYGVIQSAPNCLEQTESDAWQNNSFCFQCIIAGENRDKTRGEERDFELAAQYWLSQFPVLADKTRSIIVESFISMADSFLRGILNDLFCTKTNLVPELTHNGAIIILDLPVKEYGEVGRFAQVLFKLIWQKSVERRQKSDAMSPVFLWADEAHNFLVSQDADFQTTARSSRACTVLLTQNISNYYNVLGGEKGRAATDSLLGCLQTKIFHANGDPVTNQWAADLIAKQWETHYDMGTSYGDGGQEKDRHNIGGRRSLEYKVLPGAFHALRSGGPDNAYQVDAYLFQGNRTWRSNGQHHLQVTFNQENN